MHILIQLLPGQLGGLEALQPESLSTVIHSCNKLNCSWYYVLAIVNSGSLCLASAGSSKQHYWSYAYRSFYSLDHDFGLGFYGATAETAALAGQKCSVDVRVPVGMTARGDPLCWSELCDCCRGAVVLWLTGTQIQISLGYSSSWICVSS